MSQTHRRRADPKRKRIGSAVFSYDDTFAEPFLYLKIYIYFTTKNTFRQKKILTIDYFLFVYYNLFVKLWKNWGEYQGEIEEIDRRTVT